MVTALLHTAQFLNSSTLHDVMDSACSHLGCIEHIVVDHFGV
jgi:hypothetical protein